MRNRNLSKLVNNKAHAWHTHTHTNTPMPIGNHRKANVHTMQEKGNFPRRTATCKHFWRPLPPAPPAELIVKNNGQDIARVFFSFINNCSIHVHMYVFVCLGDVAAAALTAFVYLHSLIWLSLLSLTHSRIPRTANTRKRVYMHHTHGGKSR